MRNICETFVFLDYRRGNALTSVFDWHFHGLTLHEGRLVRLPRRGRGAVKLLKSSP
jgi:hypothetical protein